MDYFNAIRRWLEVVLCVKQNQSTSGKPASTFTVEVVFVIENAITVAELFDELRCFSSRKSPRYIRAKTVRYIVTNG
ncbi:hypothetical protein A8B84_11805 [Marinobacter sp. EhC06]|nr:hypothetical protein A8B84_11805 [Marinobacter sp. EhC06]OAN93934.1 hypothetical protein A8B80_15845 [Marinobacter sp. EhN04]